MMDFCLTDERRLLIESVRDLVARHATSEELRATESSEGGWMPDLWADLGAAGFLGLGADSLAGGSLLDGILVAIECGSALAPVPFAEASMCVPGLVRSLCGEPAIEALLSAEAVSIPVFVTPRRQGSLTVKIVPYLTAADSLVLVDRRAGAVGVIPVGDAETERIPAMGPAPYGRIRLKTHPRLEPRPAAVAAATELLDLARSALAVGGMRSAVEYAVDYVMNRRQFGRPVGSFQAIQHHLANAAMHAEQGRLLVLRAATAGPDERSAAILAARSYCLDAYRSVATTSCQVLGGYGFTLEYDAQLHLRTATSLRVMAGDVEPTILLDEARRELADTHL